MTEEKELRLTKPDLDRVTRRYLMIAKPGKMVCRGDENWMKTFERVECLSSYMLQYRRDEKGEWVCRANSTMLKEVFGRDYVKIIEALMEERILVRRSYRRSEECKPGKPFGYCFGRSVRTATGLIDYGGVSTYKARVRKYFERLQDEDMKRFELRMVHGRVPNPPFRREYETSLQMLDIRDRKLLSRFLKAHTYITKDSRAYYYSMVEKFNDHAKNGVAFRMGGPDKNNRLYSVASGMPRELRPFLNIKFSCDIHNSHPLLFGLVVMQKYGIGRELRGFVSKAVDEISVVDVNGVLCYCLDPMDRYVEEEWFENLDAEDAEFVFRSVVEFDGEEDYEVCFGTYYHYETLVSLRDRIARSVGDKYKETIYALPFDVLEYWVLTMKGMFWDVVIPKSLCQEKNMLRGDVKVTMFQEVFYSKKLGTKWKKFAQVFERRFPNVFRVSQMVKFRIDSEEVVNLANVMMKLESCLFWEILQRLYDMGFKVINIHDAIEVLAVPANERCTEELVIGLIKEVYKENGIVPDVSLEKYSKEDLVRIVEEEERLKPMVKAYKAELKARAKAGDVEAQKNLQRLEKGKAELIYNKDKTGVVVHKLK